MRAMDGAIMPCHIFQMTIVLYPFYEFPTDYFSLLFSIYKSNFKSMARATETSPAYGDRISFAEVVVVSSVFPQSLLGALGLLDLFYAPREQSAALGGSFFSFR